MPSKTMLAYRQVTIDPESFITSVINYNGGLPSDDDVITYTFVLDMNRLFNDKKNRQDLKHQHIKPILDIVSKSIDPGGNHADPVAGDFFYKVAKELDTLFTDKHNMAIQDDIVSEEQVKNSWQCTSKTNTFLSHIYRKMVEKEDGSGDEENIVLSLIKEAFAFTPEDDHLVMLNGVPWFVKGARACIDATISSNTGNGKFSTIRLQFEQVGGVNKELLTLQKSFLSPERCILSGVQMGESEDTLPSALADGMMLRWSSTTGPHYDSSYTDDKEFSVIGKDDWEIKGPDFYYIEDNSNGVTISFREPIQSLKMNGSGKTFDYVPAAQN